MSNVQKTVKEVHDGFGQALNKIYEKKILNENKNPFIHLSLLPLQPQKSSLTGIISYIVTLLSILATFFIEYINVPIRISLIAALIIILYVVLIIHFRKRICDWNDELFHYEAFKKWRKPTYQIFQEFLKNREIVDFSATINTYIDRNISLKDSQISLLEKKIENIYLTSRETIDFLNQSNIKYEKMIEVYFTLLNQLITFVESVRIGSGVINKRDHDFFNGFILYSLEGNELIPKETYNPKVQVRSFYTVKDGHDVRIQAIIDNKDYMRTDRGYVFKYQHNQKTWLYEVFIEHKKLLVLRNPELFDEGKFLVYLHNLYFITYPYLLKRRRRNVENSV